MQLFNFIFLICSLLTISLNGHAASECPWNKWSVAQLSEVNFDSSKMVSLTSEQVQEDLMCLTIIISTHYSLRSEYPMAIVPKIEKAIKTAVPMSNVELLNQIFTFHEGFIDTHLSYQAAGQIRQSSTTDPVYVTLNEELAVEQLYIRNKFTYFKPASVLDSTLSKAQTELIEHIKKYDRPLVIDLRGVQGGANILASELSKHLFTEDQHVPKSEILQIESPLKTIAFCKAILIVYGDEYKKYCEDEIKKLENLIFAELLKTTITKRVDKEDYVGMRTARFQSPIYLIIDSSCASACETIVDKLIAHPKVKAIGAHTYGALHYSNAISLVLPNSGIKISIPTRREVMEKDVPEGYGYSPNLFIKHIDLENILSL